PVDDPAHGVVGDGDEQLLLAAEEVVDRTAGLPRLVGDALDAGAVVVVLGEHPPGRREDELPLLLDREGPGPPSCSVGWGRRGAHHPSRVAATGARSSAR